QNVRDNAGNCTQAPFPNFKFVVCRYCGHALKSSPELAHSQRKNLVAKQAAATAYAAIITRFAGSAAAPIQVSRTDWRKAPSGVNAPMRARRTGICSAGTVKPPRKAIGQYSRMPAPDAILPLDARAAIRMPME